MGKLKQPSPPPPLCQHWGPLSLAYVLLKASGLGVVLSRGAGAL